MAQGSQNAKGCRYRNHGYYHKEYGNRPRRGESTQETENMSESYWCLFCGEDGPRWNTTDELFEHMKTTVHRDENGGIIFYAKN